MDRRALIVALAVAGITGVAFAIWPQLDIRIARFFYERVNPGFAPNGPIQFWRNVAYGVVVLVAAPAFIAVIVKLALPQHPMLMRPRAAVLMIATFALGPGLVNNVMFKDHWHRPRPVMVIEFGGDKAFMPWWNPRGDCPSNCSFVAGEPSAAFWTTAAASYAPPQWRGVAYGAALLFGALVGVLRMAAGGHFFSDVVLGGVFTFLIIWLAHAALYRWARTRVSDEAIEQQLQRAGLWLRAAGEHAGHRAADEIAGPDEGDDEAVKRRRRGWW